MKTFFKKITFCSLIYFALFSVEAIASSDLEEAEKNVDRALVSFERLHGEKSVLFRSKVEETDYILAMENLRFALQSIEKAKNASPSQKLDQFIEEARFLQKVLASYLGNKEFFGYRLKKGPVSIVIDSRISLERILDKLPFLGRTRIGGTITIHPGEEVVTQFNSLKAEFYGLLVEAAHLDKKDSRIKQLAKWGNETKVIYPDESFGVEIITTQQLWDLDLP